MKRTKLTALTLALLLTLSLIPASLASVPYPTTAAARPSPQPFSVNGELVDCDRYLINGANYFKLRDLAYILNGTSAEFNVGYSNGLIDLTRHTAYTTMDGSEMGGRGTQEQTAVLSPDKVRINGETEELTAYKIGGANYFKLRDVGDAMGFHVDYDFDSATVLVNTYNQELVDFYAKNGKLITVVSESKVADNLAPTAAAVDFADTNMPEEITQSVLDTLRWTHEGDEFFCYFSIPAMPDGFAVEISTRVSYQIRNDSLARDLYLAKTVSGDSQIDGGSVFFTEGNYCIVFDGMVNLDNYYSTDMNTVLPSNEVSSLRFSIEPAHIYGAETNTAYTFPEMQETVLISPPYGDSDKAYSGYSRHEPLIDDILSLWK